MSKTKTQTDAPLITSYEEACQKLEIPDGIPDVSTFPTKHQASLIAFAKLVIIAEALNDKWEPDWNNGDEYKYYPWFDMEVDENNPSGFRFNDSYCEWTFTYSAGGSRLCFRTRALSDYAGKTFESLYRELMVIPKK